MDDEKEDDVTEITLDLNKVVVRDEESKNRERHTIDKRPAL
ncbi:hypothetical protein [Streptomyces sp. NBC_01465]|nr:hypothetical protein [Streptomyces sp. NBC_01465]